MRVLLDTHALLWFLLDDPALSRAARELIRTPDTQVLVSPASYWEIAIKISIRQVSTARAPCAVHGAGACTQSLRYPPDWPESCGSCRWPAFPSPGSIRSFDHCTSDGGKGPAAQRRSDVRCLRGSAYLVSLRGQSAEDAVQLTRRATASRTRFCSSRRRMRCTLGPSSARSARSTCCLISRMLAGCIEKSRRPIPSSSWV